MALPRSLASLFPGRLSQLGVGTHALVATGGSLAPLAIEVKAQVCGGGLGHWTDEKQTACDDKQQISFLALLMDRDGIAPSRVVSGVLLTVLRKQ